MYNIYKLKNLGINLSNDIIKIYYESYRTLMTIIKSKQNNQMSICIYRLEEQLFLEYSYDLSQFETP